MKKENIDTSVDSGVNSSLKKVFRRKNHSYLGIFITWILSVCVAGGIFYYLSKERILNFGPEIVPNKSGPKIVRKIVYVKRDKKESASDNTVIIQKESSEIETLNQNDESSNDSKIEINEELIKEINSDDIDIKKIDSQSEVISSKLEIDENTVFATVYHNYGLERLSLFENGAMIFCDSNDQIANVPYLLENKKLMLIKSRGEQKFLNVEKEGVLLILVEEEIGWPKNKGFHKVGEIVFGSLNKPLLIMGRYIKPCTFSYPQEGEAGTVIIFKELNND